MPEMIGANIVDGHRIYDIQMDDGSVLGLPSVTTIFKILPVPRGLQIFQQRPDAAFYTARRAMIGTTCHFYLECKNARLLPGHTPELEDVNYADHLDADSVASIANINRKIDSVMRKNKFEPESMEIPLFSTTLGAAGRVDWQGTFNDKKAILDLKTSKAFHDETKAQYAERLDYMEDHDGRAPADFTSKYAMQLSAYAFMYKELYNVDTEELWILRVNENNKPELRLMPYMIEDFMDVRDMYRNEYGR